MKANKYADLLEDTGENVHYLKQQVMKLEQEIEKGSNYEEGCQGKGQGIMPQQKKCQ